ncbi:hypothetical protein [Aestuariibaculum marinum]|uniref:hypothetical protein n=1 Tax=Aestuariibaculum marinum TaxID=2683592 RepID=UPI001F51414C|nr:hypothetical protein [Aestuariibaculum marinum]
MKPLKRHKALQPLSREHHYGLLLTWKIRTGFKKISNQNEFTNMPIGFTRHI